MSELYDRYRLYFMLERKNERNNQFQHTTHLLSENVLTAACPMYYTCKYYNAYVEICLYIEKPPLYLLTKIGSEGRGPPAGGQFRRVSRGGTSSVVAAYTGLSHFFKAIEAKIAIQTLGRLSTKSNISIIIFTSIIHRASGGQHILRKEV